MRVGQINKFADTVNGQQIKRAPFLRTGFRWEPADGEVYGFMTSGIARFNLDNNNVQERSNVALYRWGVGPTNNVNFTEVPRGADGRPVGDGEPVDDEEPEVCVEPEVPATVNASHTYTGPAQGLVVITGAQNATLPLSENVSIVVKDDRSLTFTVSDETFSSAVAQDGTFEGVYNLSALGGSCQIIISVTGLVSGKNSSGTAQGIGNCIGSQANFNATYSATSPTEPSYLDQRPNTPKPRSVCGNNASVIPAVTLLLGEE